jgi:hypothetical protein
VSLLAHATAGAAGAHLERETRALADLAQHEVAEARRIQAQTGCTWTEALRIAYQNNRKENP